MRRNLLILAILAVTLFVSVHANDDKKALLRQLRARMLLMGYVHYQFETDNGRFPFGKAELRWPIDYIGSFEKMHGVRWDRVSSDPLNGGTIIIRPVSEPRYDQGVDFEDQSTTWTLIASKEAEYLASYEVLFPDAVSDMGHLLRPTPQSESNNRSWIITDDEIRAFFSREPFAVEQLLLEADLVDE